MFKSDEVDKIPRGKFEKVAISLILACSIVVLSIALVCGIIFCVTSLSNIENTEYVDNEMIDETTNDSSSVDYRFNIREYNDGDLKIIIDTQTGVQYLCYYRYASKAGGVGMTVLLDSDGSPLLVEGAYDDGWTE